jgi:hypothetical protein
MMWLSEKTQAAADFVGNHLLSHSATGNTATGGSRTLAQSGLRKRYAGASAARHFGIPVSDLRHPDVWGIVQPGVVYTGGKGKIASTAVPIRRIATCRSSSTPPGSPRRGLSPSSHFAERSPHRGLEVG